MWGIHWHRCALVGLDALGGLIAAVGHHLYYDNMSGTIVSNSSS